MKILFLHSLADPSRGGGAERILWTSIRGLRDAGNKCVLLATSDEPGLRRTEWEGITVWLTGIRNVYWPYHKKRPMAPLRLLWHALDSFNPWMQGYIRQVVREEKPDVASLHNLQGWSAASWQTLVQQDVPVVQVLHDHYFICAKATMFRNERNCTSQCGSCRIFRLPHRTLSRRVQGVVGVSRFILERHQVMGYFEGVPIQRVIHNVCALETLGLNKGLSSELHVGLRFGFIGRLDPSKGIEPLIQAFQDADLSDAELLIAGSGKQHYEDQLRKGVNDKRVHILGQVEPRDFYPRVDVVIVPSLYNDTLPSVVFEALAYGKPVIGSKLGGISEMIREGENGLLFEPDGPAELAGCLRRIHDDTALRARLTANAQPSSRPFIDLPAWVATYEALYRDAQLIGVPTQAQED